MVLGTLCLLFFALPRDVLAQDCPASDEGRERLFSTLTRAPITDKTVEELVAKGCECRLSYIPGIDVATTQVFGDARVIFSPDGKPVPVRGVDQSNYDTDGDATSVTFCTPPVANQVKTGSVEIAVDNSISGQIKATFISVMQSILGASAGIGAHVLNFGAKLFSASLVQSRYCSHPFVTSGWPFIQGFANLGFIVALLFIAFATVVQLEAFNARKYLPRILVAALLLNFSLVIGCIIIDTSRILMALLVTIMGQGRLTSIGFDLLKNSPLMEEVFKKSSLQNLTGMTLTTQGTGWDILTKTIIATALIWTVAATFFIGAVAMFVRYVFLLLLLVVSPVAFLFFALPGAEGYARQWWREFLKWVFYGPIFLFIMVLLVAFGNAFSEFEIDGVFQGMVGIAMMVIMMLVAVRSARSLGGIGGAAAVGFVTGAATRVGRGGIAGTAATVRGAGQYIARRTGLDEALRIRGEAQKKAEEGRVKKTRLAQAAQRRYATPQQKEQFEWADQAKADQPTRYTEARDAARNPAMAANRLRSKEVGKVVNQTQIRAVIDRGIYDSDNDDQLEALAGNTEIVEKMNLENQNLLINELRNRMMKPVKTPADQAAKDNTSLIYNNFQRTLRAVEQRQTAPK